MNRQTDTGASDRPASPEDMWNHCVDMAFRRGYAAAFYLTCIVNETRKEEGKPLVRFDPKDPEAIYREAR